MFAFVSIDNYVQSSVTTHCNHPSLSIPSLLDLDLSLSLQSLPIILLFSLLYFCITRKPLMYVFCLYIYLIARAHKAPSFAYLFEIILFKISSYFVMHVLKVYG